MNILFVCTGNSCRSPMAEAYCKMVFCQNNRADITVMSAGTSTIDGYTASTQAQVVACNFGGSLADFYSTRLTKNILEDCDLIIAMTNRHYDVIKSLNPHANVKLLFDYLNNNHDDVPDPYGENVEGYQYCFNSMKMALDKLIEVILKG